MAVTRPLTLDEFLLRPEEQPALEYERGVVTQKMSPMAKHGTLEGELYFRFRMHQYPRVAVKSMTETRVTWLTEGISYVPDVIAYRVERVPSGVDREILDRLVVPPDVAVEIPSPGQTLDSQVERCRWYVQHGVKAALLVHPGRKAVWVFRAGAETGPLTGDAVVDLGDVFDGFSFVVAELFVSLLV
ncbi:MAG: Uma2 family endonuclease [Chloroflexi bacterium]|nr:Uma2 family endonuclease [Chloroflexota bacterium]